ncbi:MAG: 50S ribosomal protein L30 [Thermoleophilaceae bacterium]
MSDSIKLKQVRSANGSSRKQHDTLRSLGLGRIGKSAERADGPALRGQIQAVRHLIELEDG